MLLQDGTIKVADFGIARFLQSETQTMTDKAIGSVHYIAPEQARGDYITDKADIYSLGVMLYEMLTGKLPFVADNAVSVALMQLQAKPVMPRELNPSIPRGLEQITMRAMEKNPADRFQSAGEMLDDLDRFRRDPNMVFHYDLQTNSARYDASRSMEAYDASRQMPAYNDDYEYEEELVRSRRSAKGAMVVKGVLAAAIIVGLAVAVIYFLNYWNNRPDEDNDLIEMPSLVGQLFDDVAANEEYADFKFEVIEGNDPDLQPGEIMNQNPQAGIMVRKDADVELLVNGGVDQVEVPDVVTDQMTWDQAEQVLEDAGLVPVYTPVASDDVEENHVISTDPAAGTSVASGSRVTVNVSTGPAEEMVTIPSGLVGDTLANVSAKLEDAGLTIGQVNRDDTSTLTVDTVISLTPDEGSEVSKGSSVDITVSSGKGATKTLSTSITLPNVDEDLTLKVYQDGTQVTTDTVNPAYGSSYSLSFTGTSGSDVVVVTLNDQPYMELEFNYDSQSVQITREYDFTSSQQLFQHARRKTAALMTEKAAAQTGRTLPRRRTLSDGRQAPGGSGSQGNRGILYRRTPEGDYTCTARGKFRKERISPYAGDRVRITGEEDGTGALEEILPRRNFLVRPPIANIDQLFIVSSLRDPYPEPLIIDKTIAVAELREITPVLVLTKTDLEDASGLKEIYDLAGIPCLVVSSVTGEGVDQVRRLLTGKISAFTGNSGVGKSSLLNAVFPQFDLKNGGGQPKAGPRPPTPPGRWSFTSWRAAAM